MTEYQTNVLNALESISVYLKVLKERLEPCPPIRSPRVPCEPDNLDYTPLVVPVGQKIPETTNQAIERMLLASGAITREQWEHMKGINYDGDDFEDDDEDFDPIDDEFEQSSLASYDVKRVEVPHIDEPKQIEATAVQEKQSQGAPVEAPVVIDESQKKIDKKVDEA